MRNAEIVRKTAETDIRIALELDGRLEEYRRALEATPAPTEDPTLAEPEAPIAPTPEAQEKPASSFSPENRMKPMWIIAGVTVLAAVAAVLLMLPGKDERKGKHATKDKEPGPRH